MKKSTVIALFIIACAAPAAYAQPAVVQVQYAQPICTYPAHWVWRGYWNCEYPVPVHYPRSYYYPHYGYYGGHVGGGYYGGGGHVGGGHSGGHHGGHR
jgi:hypothetical protein